MTITNYDAGGTGIVTVSSSNTGCASGTGSGNPNICKYQIPEDSSIEIEVFPGTNSAFRNWGQDCTGSSSKCPISMSDDRSVTATFISDR